MTFPIAETFYSIQGEGFWAGTPMFFIRLAGCNVGKYTSGAPSLRVPEGNNPKTGVFLHPFQLLHPEYATCTSFSGEKFICDTDYRVKERLTIEQIVALIPNVDHVVLTGGEPFIHKDLYDLITTLSADYKVHIETSGTISIPWFRLATAAWLTCSPKQGFVAANQVGMNEYKFLVRNAEDEEAVMQFIDQYQIEDHIYIQPIDEMSPAEIDQKITRSQRDFAVECVKRHPSWKLSVQMHKVLGVR